MDIEARLAIVKRVAEEIITEKELRELIETNEHPSAYDGFECSGESHLGSGLFRAIQIQDLLSAGIRFKLLIADWYAWINDKLGGDLDRIKKAGDYLIEVWKACGVDFDKVDVVWTSDVVGDPSYWKLVLNVAKNTTVDRMKRASTVMGRKMGEIQYTAMLMYPAMQTADPFYLGVDICQLGIDQRRCGILSREVGPRLGFGKPVCVYHHLLIGLHGPVKMGGFETDRALNREIASKMSKSLPKTYISVHDEPEAIREKIRAAYCPERVVKGNPIMEICRYVILRRQKSFLITRSKKYGGDIEFDSYAKLETAYKERTLHPKDLKDAVAEALVEILRPVREHFQTRRDLLEVVRPSEVTR